MALIRQLRVSKAADLMKPWVVGLPQWSIFPEDRSRYCALPELLGVSRQEISSWRQQLCSADSQRHFRQMSEETASCVVNYENFSIVFNQQLQEPRSRSVQCPCFLS